MKEIKRRRTHCIICERELPKISHRGRKRKRIITCSPLCSKDYTRVRMYANCSYIHEIKQLKKRIKDGL